MEAREVRSDGFKLSSSGSVSRSSIPVFGRDDGAGGRSQSSVRATENSVELWSNDSHGVNSGRRSPHGMPATRRR